MLYRTHAAFASATRTLLAASALTCLAGCGSSDADTRLAREFVETGDLLALRRWGVVRVLVPAPEPQDLDRHDPLAYERDLLEAWADANALEVDWKWVPSRDDLIPRLLDGRGDVIAANLTATPERRARVVFTVPLDFVREQVVTRSGDDSIERPADLAGRRISVRRSSSFWSTLEELRLEYPEIEVEEAPENLETEELIHRVASRRLDLTVADSNLIDSVLGYRDDLRVACDLTQERPIAFAVRPGSRELLRSLNRFLTDNQLSERHREQRTGDLDEIRRRQVLRVLTRNSASTYFLWRGQLMGFEYELAREFAKRHGVRVEVIVPPSRELMIDWLLQGRGDVIAAGLTQNDENERQGAAFSRPYNYVSPMVVARATETGLESIDDLAGHRFLLRRGSRYWDRLSRLREESGLSFELEALPNRLDAEEIISQVAEGSASDLTVSHSHVLDIEMTWRRDVRGAFPLEEPVPLAWAVRDSNPELKAAIDAFFDREYKGLFYNVIYKRYFEDPKKILRHQEHRFTANGALSPWDDVVKRFAEQYDFDWRLIVALMYQESRFDPQARSFAGAQGLLQVMPRTGRQMGFRDLRDPEKNIEAGIKYLAWLRDRFDADLPPTDRLWFTLASYNAGHEHVRDARRLAVEEGWDPNRWFDHVEQAIYLLSRSEYARKARYGYCRGSEPVNYVREINARYKAYREAEERKADTATAFRGRS